MLFEAILWKNKPTRVAKDAVFLHEAKRVAESVL